LDDKKGGGVIIELGVHEIDFIRWIGGEWQSVYARGSSQIIAPGRFQEAVSAVGVLSNDVTARLDVSWASPRYLWQRSVEGTEGSLFFDDSCIEQVALHRAGKEPEIFAVGGWQDENTKENLSLREQAKSVLNSLQSKSTPQVTLRDGKAAVEVALAIRESARSGKVVPLGEYS
jgi:predicted dehydrogenase